MSEDQPLVSVIMPAYNAEKFIAKSIDSIVQQRYSNWELIIVDDGSTDGTNTIAQEYSKKDSRIKLIVNETNKGLVETRNRGLQHSTGMYIANLDSDDIAHPERLVTQVEFLKSNPNYMVIGSACDVIDVNGRKIGEVNRKIPDKYIRTLLLFSNYFVNSSVMVIAELAKEIGYSTAYPMSEDYNFFVRMSEKGEMGNLNRNLVQYRVHESNTSTRRDAEIVKADKEIQAVLLTRMGVKASPEELELHSSLVDGKYAELGFDLPQVESWLLKLVEVNKESETFEPHSLGHFSAFFYRRACENSKLGLKAIQVFRRSSLSKGLDEDLKGNLAFFVRTIVNRF